MRSLSLMLILCSILPFEARAAEAEAGRYRLERTEQGFVRLDTATGAVSLCRFQGENLICRMAADERSAYQDRIDQIEKRLAALERKIGTGDRPAASGLPSDAEIDRSIGVMERFMRSFMGLVDEFRSEDKTSSPVPDRT